jgi:aspartate 1-decarboxylase
MRLRQLLKAKLHHARVTYANPDYVGSIELGGDLMDEVGLVDGELVHVWAVEHTARLQTYVFRGPRGVVGLNGGAAHFFQPGDLLVIAAFDVTDEFIEPKVVLLDENNRVVRHMNAFATVG